MTVHESAKLLFDGTQAVTGNGAIVLSHTDLSGLIAVSSGMTLTIDTGITVRGSGTIGWSPTFGGGQNVSLQLLGKVVADVAFGAIRLDPNGSGTIRISGELAALDGGLIHLRGTTVFSESSTLTQSGDGTIRLFRGFSSEMISPSQFKVSGIVTFDGTGTAGNPNLLEVMGVDRGLTSAGFQNNFGFGMLSLNGAEYVKLVDEVDNSYGNGPEALYANSIFVPAGTTLDLNGFNVYVRSLLLEGQVINGTIQQMLDSGELAVGTPTPGVISTSGERDEWTFFSRADRDLTIEINFGSGGVNPALQPSLDWGTVTVFDPNGQILAVESSTEGGVIRFRHLQTPLEGSYRVRIQASNGHVFETGNYVLSVYDSTSNRRSLLLNEPVSGILTTPYADDRWEFTADSVTSLKFDLRNSSTPGISFTLIGPNDFVVIPETTGDSAIVTLPFSGTYTLIAHHLSGRTGSYSFSLDQTSLGVLPFNGSVNETLTRSGQAKLFKVTVPSTQILTLQLSDPTTTDRIEMYARYGSPPTRGVYDYRFNAPGSNQRITVPSATAGDWYVLIYSENVPTSRNVSLSSSGVFTTLSSVVPEISGNSVPVTMKLTGAGFVAGTSVSLVSLDGTRTYSPQNFSIDSLTQITATFPSQIPSGHYSIRVNTPYGSYQLQNSFEFTTGTEAHLETELIIPAVLGRHAFATLYIEYANTGDVPMPAP
ncbi:MAG: PPC domain-containing protein, partial [Planctomycetaceae bacterium]|nr:PPC domain-containing protein [Planctomycetaceae bacterium]